MFLGQLAFMWSNYWSVSAVCNWEAGILAEKLLYGFNVTLTLNTSIRGGIRKLRTVRGFTKNELCLLAAPLICKQCLTTDSLKKFKKCKSDKKAIPVLEDILSAKLYRSFFSDVNFLAGMM